METVGFMIPQIKNSVQVNESIVLLRLFFRRSVSMCFLQNNNCYIPNNNDNEAKLFNETLLISQKIQQCKVLRFKMAGSYLKTVM